MRVRVWLALAAVGIAPAGLAAVPADAAERRVLLVTEARGFVHDSIPAARSFVIGLGRRSPRYEVIPLDGGAAALTPRRLRRADAVVFANTSGELPVPDRPALRRFVRRGGAFVGTHSASDTLHSWPAYASILGAEFARHGAVQEGRLVVAHRRHPVTRGLPSSFRLTDEFYEFRGSVAPRTRVLVRLDPASVHDELRSDMPLVWTRRYGRGRVFYSALGHPAATWTNPHHSRLLARGLRWALAGTPAGPR